MCALCPLSQNTFRRRAGAWRCRVPSKICSWDSRPISLTNASSHLDQDNHLSVCLCVFVASRRTSPPDHHKRLSPPRRDCSRQHLAVCRERHVHHSTARPLRHHRPPASSALRSSAAPRLHQHAPDLTSAPRSLPAAPRVTPRRRPFTHRAP